MFRLKIALLSALLSGLVLVSIGFYSLSVMSRVSLERIDREILSLGQGHLAVAPPREYWQNFEQALTFIYHEERTENPVVLIKGPGNDVLYRSPLWPAEIDEAVFPQFDRVMDTRPRETIRPENEVRPDPNRAARRDERRSPPAEAYRACIGRAAGSESRFTDAGGEVFVGTCEDEGGRLVLRPYRNRPDQRGEAATPPLGQEARKPLPKIKRHFFTTLETATGTWRTCIMGSERITMMVAVNLSVYLRDMRRYQNALLGAIPVALLLLAAGGWLIAQRALKPVDLITRTAERITARDLDQRIPSSGRDDELSRLVRVINGMLERLEKSFHQAIRFSANAAHELQTPLAILQGELDDAVQHAAAGSEEQQRCSGLLEEVQRLKSIIQKLLILARADAGRLELHLEAKDLSAMIEAAAEDAEVMAPQLRIEKDILPGVMANVDPDLMGQAIGNLVSNAVKYNRECGRIRFRLTVSDKQARLTVSNTSLPIPAAEREKIFDRFYRVDQSRSKALPGAGLGLSLAREIARAHHGDLRLENDIGDMISFTLSLPCHC